MNIAFVVVGLAVSIFHGAVATDVFGVPSKDRSLAWKIHQFWLNFLGSISGWCALWFLFQSISPCVMSVCSNQFGWPDVALFLLAYLGITGYVPFTVIGLAKGINEFATKAMDLVK